MNASSLANRSIAYPGVRDSSHRPSIGILSTYLPTVCGLATFSSALTGALSAKGIDVSVVRIADGTPSADCDVVGELVNGEALSVAAASRRLNDGDIAVIQHEYGIYGGTDGDEVVEIMQGLRVPSIVVVHTVLKEPTPHQRSVLEDVVASSGYAVVMSAAARTLLCAGYAVDPQKVIIIPHGAALPEDVAPPPVGRPTILTWGLLGPGKGVERVIDAMVSLSDLPDPPRYLVAGRTHPKVFAAQGEAYREGLMARAQRLGVADSVCFDATYRSPHTLAGMLREAAVVVLPYDSKDQVTSGVLIDSIASGRPVVATAFPHAVEVLGGGAGTVVDHDDPGALSHALRWLLTDPDTAGSMAVAARRMAPATAWPVVADSYAALAQRLVSAEPARA